MRLLTITLFCLITVAISAQAPVNDDCAGLIDLGEAPFCSDPAQYTNVNAGASIIDVGAANIPACFDNGVDRDVWFQFTVPADGSLVDVIINVYGNVNGNGTMQMPQVAIYRGDCQFGGLAELDCASAPLNVNEVSLAVLGLTPGLPYFLRINDYSATASPNAGTFRLCVEEYVPDFIMGETASTTSCSGTLWDSGGPNGDYSTNENLAFTICPQDFHQCIVLNVEQYDIESGFDFLQFFQGDDVNGVQLTQITGDGSNFTVQIPAPCATIGFTSDFSAELSGFHITWTCTTEACTTPPVTTCADPQPIPALPYTADLSNCFSGNTLFDGPCNNDDGFLNGNDYIFAYTSAGNECIRITTQNTIEGAGIGVYNLCPDQPGADCIAQAYSPFAENPSINSAFLENPGTYYIVFGTNGNCSAFNINVETIECPVVLPNASNCDDALDIGGCSTLLPQIIALTPGAGDPDFIVNGLNQGCFVAPMQNYSFFYFQAGADGNFGFTVQAANPNEASDIDFNVWGPINSVSQICDFVSNNQPVRSSWAAGADPTGLADTNPVLGTPVNDAFDCGSTDTPSAGGDDFVSTLPVVEGKIYVVMLDDFGNAIVNDGISIDFGATTEGVLNQEDGDLAVSGDTVICAGQPVTLSASGGVTYFWSPADDLSCQQCPATVATPIVTTEYQVAIVATCQTYERAVTVKVFDLDLGPDALVCVGAEFELNPNPAEGALYSWSGPVGLSCTNCPTPTYTATAPGSYTYVATMTTPFCILKDTLVVTVLNGLQPEYEISENQDICLGETVSLGGVANPNTVYSWGSSPAGFSANIANPPAMPTQTTVYYLTTANTDCPVAAIDSVVVRVFTPPVVQFAADTVICIGESVTLSSSLPENDVTYAWTPGNATLSDPNALQAIATPGQTTTYMLTAQNPGCAINGDVTVAVVPLTLGLSVPDTLLICLGTSVPIQANVSPGNLVVGWTPIQQLQLSPNGHTALATPNETITYTATVALPGCTRTEKVYIQVDSLPLSLSIAPDDTTVCIGSQVLLVSPIYEPAEFPDISFTWMPGIGQLTPDSLYNLVISPVDTTVYYRITVNGACRDTATMLVNVIIPPDMTLTPPTSAICTGQSVNFELTIPPGVEDIQWSPDNTLSCNSCANPVATPALNTTYTASGTYFDCPVSVSASVSVNNPPAIVFPSDVNICQGESITLNLANDTSATYTWTSNDPNFGTITTAQPTITPTQTFTYFVNATNGCANQGQVTVFVTGGTLTVSNDTTICQNFKVPLSASTNVPGTITWSTGETGNAILVMPMETSTYYVTFAFGDDCVLTDSVSVTVQGQGGNIEFPSQTGLCPGQSVVLNQNPTPGATYVWTSNPPGFTSNSPTPSVQPAQTTTYTVTTSLGSCVLTDSVTIVVYSATLQAMADTSVCSGSVIEISALTQGTGQILWSNGVTENTFTDTIQQSITYTVAFTYGQSANCLLQDQVTISTIPGFNVGLALDPDTTMLGLGESLDLTAILTPSQSLAGFNFSWTQNGAAVGSNSDMITVTPPNDAQGNTLVNYSITVTAPNGCTDTASVIITVKGPRVEFPNAFSPNGDGVNDVFRMIVLVGPANIDQMRIFNRWGRLVFDSRDPNAAWDGKFNGEEAPSDVYVYIIEWRDGLGALREVKKGEITLLR